jgi:hypothetical protein
MCVSMRFFSRGSHNRRGNNRGRGLGPWKRGNKRLRFSIHFDADSEEFNQLLQTSFLNLVGQQAYRPPPIPENPHPSIGIPVPNHNSSPLVMPERDGWKDIVHPPPRHSQGWPNIDHPQQPPFHTWPTGSFPPPPPLHPNLQPQSQASHAHHKAKITELEGNHEEEKVAATKSKSSHESSHSVTSHMQENDQKYAKEDSSIGKNEGVERSHSKRGATSHK